MSPMLHEEILLREAVKTMMAQLCKVGVTYSCELAIEGTIGVTVDKTRTIVIHFDDRVSQPTLSDTLGNSTTLNISDIAPILSSTTSLENAVDCLRHLGSEAATLAQGLVGSSLSQTVPSTPLATPGKCAWFDSSKMMNYFRESSPDRQTLNERVAIDIDSGSDSFDNYQLDEFVEPNEANAKAAKTPKTSSQKKKKSSKRKNVIVIEDNDLFEPDLINSHDTSSMQSYTSEYGHTDLKSLASFCSQIREPPSPADTDSIPEPSDSRSFGGQDFSPGNQSGECSSDVKTFNSRPATSPSRRRICEVCGQHVSSVCQLESHLVSKHNIVNHKRLGCIVHQSCPDCGKKYRFQAQLDKHMVRHESERPYKCRKCRNTYRYEQSLQLHLRVHENNLRCNVCDKKYLNKVLFQKHIAYMHEKMQDGKT